MKTVASIALAFAFALLVSMASMAIAPGENHASIWTPDYTITKIAFALSWILAFVIIQYRADWPDVFFRAMLLGTAGWGWLTAQSFYGSWFSSSVPVTMLLFCLACTALAFRESRPNP